MPLVLTGPVIRRRLALLMAIFFALFLVLGLRLFSLQLLQAEELQLRAQNQWTSESVIRPTRGKILDRNGAVLAQLGCPDMRGPIGYAMSYPERLPYEAKRLNFAQIGLLSFAEPDLDRFPALGYAVEALKAGGAMPIVLNGANEAAVAAFLVEKITFGRIPEILSEALSRIPQRSIGCIADVYDVDAEARACANDFIRRL